RMDLLVSPALSVRVSPEIAIIPAGAASASREVRVTVVNDAPAAADTTVKLDLPHGWTASPPQQTVALARQDQWQTVRFQAKPPAAAAPGAVRVQASATAGGRPLGRGVPGIEYPPTAPRHTD